MCLAKIKLKRAAIKTFDKSDLPKYDYMGYKVVCIRKGDDEKGYLISPFREDKIYPGLNKRSKESLTFRCSTDCSPIVKYPAGLHVFAHMKPANQELNEYFQRFFSYARLVKVYFNEQDIVKIGSEHIFRGNDMATIVVLDRYTIMEEDYNKVPEGINR